MVLMKNTEKTGNIVEINTDKNGRIIGEIGEPQIDREIVETINARD